jgi:hypothetical protein
MRAAMKAEFDASLAAESDKPGAGAIRGLAADEKLDTREITGAGTFQAWLLSAQFPGPVAARDFVAAVCTGSEALGMEFSGTKAAGSEGMAEDKEEPVVPRHFMIVSRPLQEHPEAGARSGYVRAQYESVEMIREIPLSRAGRAQLRARAVGGTSDDSSSKDNSDAKHKDSKDVGKDAEPSSSASADKTTEIADVDPELNPVEWLMVSRSDPGGGIPRFLVDRGTPETMLADVGKFLDWACKWKVEGDSEGEVIPPAPRPSTNVSSITEGEAKIQAPRSATEPVPTQGGGILSSLTNAIENSVEAYAPRSVSSLLHSRLHGASSSDDESDTSSLSISDTASFMSASSGQLHREDPLVLNDHANSSTSSLSAAGKEKLEKHEKELQKLLHKRERLNAEHAKHRAAEEAKLRRLQASASEEAAKRSARREREMEKASEKHRKAVEKLEARGRKERRRMENKEAKQREKEEKKLEEEEEEERKKNEKLNGEGLTAQEVRDLRERLLQAETWRKIVEARIARAVEAGGDDEKGSSRSRISAILEGVDAEVSDEIQRTRITAPSTTTLPPMSPP